MLNIFFQKIRKKIGKQPSLKLKSVGFKAGEGSQSNSVRQGVKNAVERGVAAASACTEGDVDVAMYPVGLDRALVLATSLLV